VDETEFPQAEDGGTGPGREPVPAVGTAASPAVTGPTTLHVAAPTAAPKKRGRGLAIGAVAVTLVAAVGIIVGVSAGSHSAAPPAAPAPKATANQAVLTAIDSTLGAKTADLHLSMVLTVPGKAQITATGDGSIDFTSNAAQMTVGYGGEQGLDNVRLTERFVGGSAYMSVSELSTIVPGKTWIAIPVGGSTLAPGSSNPASMLQVLQAEGDIVTPLGASVVNGTSVEGYHVVVSEAALSKRLAQENLPRGLEQAAQAAKGMFGPGGLSMTVYVSDANHLLVRLVMDLHLSLAGVSASGTVTEDTSDFGVPVSVTAPPADQVASFQQFTQAMANLTGSAPTS